ncbi:MAG: excinuclease ABC subunit UvrC [Pseudomonadota bacterium]
MSESPSLDATAPETETPPLRGVGVIADAVTRLPNKPGVYRMFSADGTVLYVGKAKSLKKRVQSYARMGGHSNRIARMIAATASMEFVTTATETEALLLEANLIKRLKPRFNVVLRDDKSFPYILIAEDHDAPQIVKHRGARRRKGTYFGPFASAGAVDRTINALQRAFLLRSCSDGVYESRTRPCLLHQIKRCAAPCTGEIEPDAYKALVGEAQDFLSGKSQTVRNRFSEAMQKASEALDFETAAIYRDRLTALSITQSHQGINPRGVEEADVFACHQDGGQTCVQVFFFRTGQNWGNRAYYPRADRADTPEMVLEAFIGQFYDDRPAPRSIFISHDFETRSLLAEALTFKSGHKVDISQPKRGEKRDLVDHAVSNARDALGRRLAETASQQNLMQGVADAFGLEKRPRRVEVYDNSHIQGSNPVGVMIVAGPDGFAKNQYRKFNIKSDTLTPGDDYAMMREVLTRRLSRLQKEHPRDEVVATTEDSGDAEGPEETADSVPAWPDILMIDGGAGQLSAVRGVLADLGLEDLPVVGIAKGPDRDAGRERFFMPEKDPFSLPDRDPVLYFVQRMRDEAHRFAIGTHRAKRKKAMATNPLDEIAGIGPSRKRALLHHFGSAKAVARANLDDLEAVDGINAAMARIIYDHFQGEAG